MNQSRKLSGGNYKMLSHTKLHIGRVATLTVIIAVMSFISLAEMFDYLYDDYHVYPAGTRTCIYVHMNYCDWHEEKLFELRDSDGTVFDTRKFGYDNRDGSFVFDIPTNWEVGEKHLLRVYEAGKSEPVSPEFPVFLMYEKLPVKCVSTDKRQLAVTVVCAGGGDTSAGYWLDAFEKYGGKGTFFVSGRWAEQHPESIRRMAEAGHDIGSHAYNHDHFPGMPYTRMKYELDKTYEIVKDITDGYEMTMFRAPFEEWTYTMNILCADLGYEVIHFTYDSRDWVDGISVDAVLRNSMRSTIKGGDIIQFHVNKTGKTEIDEIFNYYVNTLGFELVTMNELISNQKGE